MSKPEMFASKIESVHKRTLEYDSPWIHCHDCGATWAQGKASPVVCTMTESAMLELRERQLADCTRAMREVSEGLRTMATRLDSLLTKEYGLLWTYADGCKALAQKLDAARAGKGEK